jgi:hypothetical protein
MQQERANCMCLRQSVPQSPVLASRTLSLQKLDPKLRTRFLPRRLPCCILREPDVGGGARRVDRLTL